MKMLRETLRTLSFLLWLMVMSMIKSLKPLAWRMRLIDPNAYCLRVLQVAVRPPLPRSCLNKSISRLFTCLLRPLCPSTMERVRAGWLKSSKQLRLWEVWFYSLMRLTLLLQAENKVCMKPPAEFSQPSWGRLIASKVMVRSLSSVPLTERRI